MFNEAMGRIEYRKKESKIPSWSAQRTLKHQSSYPDHRFRWINSRETAAGVTPGIRAA